MKLHQKIAISLSIVIVAIILLSNGVFSRFFSIYLERQEEENNDSITKSIEAFFSERIEKYLSIVNDYSHWDDTYDFIVNSDQEFIKTNFNENFENLQISFVIIADEEYAIRYQQYYDLSEKKLSSMPPSLTNNILNILKQTKNLSDWSTVFKIEDQYYFIAKSDVTDSLQKKDPNGTMLFGRVIDKDIVKNLEEITNGSFQFLPGHKESGASFDKKTAESALLILTQTRSLDQIFLQFVIPNNAIPRDSVAFRIVKPRGLYINGMEQIRKFILSYSIGMLLVLMVLFILMGRFISKPFIKLIREVKEIDIAQNDIRKLDIQGNDEFSVLRSSVNKLLGEIETEREKLCENQEKLYATLTSVGDGVISVDQKGFVNFINPVAQMLTGWNQSEACGTSFEEVFRIINEYTREEVESPVRKAILLEEVVALANHTILIAKDGTERAIEDTAAPIRDKKGNVIGVVLVFRDFSEKKEKRKQIEYLSYHDQLTGLYNRRFFEEELNRIDTKNNLPISFLFADVNGLKTMNDAFGHQQGDNLLKEVAQDLLAACRNDDVICRTGGDEFIVLLSKSNAVTVENIAKRIKERIEQKKIMDINLSISLGWNTKYTVDESTVDVIKNAEDIMYQKKILEGSSKRGAVIKSIINTLYLKSPRENAHSKRVSLLCEAMGKWLGLSQDEIKELGVAGELHDIGKIAIDEAILKKPDQLTDLEWSEIKRHPEIGHRLLGTSGEYYRIAQYVLAHHERWDGKGYPNKLKGEEINWKARIITVADAFDAMTCQRPYKKGISFEEAIREIQAMSGTQFDPQIASQFISMIKSMPADSILLGSRDGDAGQ